MDPKLAEIYGTNTPDEADIEKLAAAELADQLADDGDADLDEVDEDTLEALAQEVLEANDADDGSDGADEGQMKVAEADYLGRVMAHAYVQELRGIDKEAAKSYGPAAQREAVKRGLATEKAGLREKATVGARRAAKSTEKAGRSVLGRISKAGKSVAESKAGKAVGRGAGKVGKHLKAHRGKYALGLGAAGLAGAGGLVAKKLKESSALETLAEQHALEILAANGIDPFQQEKQSGVDPYDALTATVEQRAWEMLQEAGYVSDE